MRVRHPLYPPVNRRAIAIAVVAAVAAHGAAFAWLATHHADPTTRRPPAAEGLGGDAAVGGLPLTHLSNAHQFKVVTADSEIPIAGAHVINLLGESDAHTNQFGMVDLGARPGARLIVQVRKAGFATYAEEIGNLDRDTPVHTILMKRAPVPWFEVDTILYVRCTYCHGRVGTTASLDFTTHERLMRSSSPHGPVVVAGKPEQSPLVRVLIDSLGPDRKRTAHARVTANVTREEVEMLAEWVREGAKHSNR
jgi:hypothetical protein